jgi:hypothetical protein
MAGGAHTKQVLFKCIMQPDFFKIDLGVDCAAVISVITRDKTHRSVFIEEVRKEVNGKQYSAATHLP